MSAQLSELRKQHDALCHQRQDLAGQLSAARSRQGDLEKQLRAASDELAKLGLMQLGKRMMLRAEQDNIRKKLAANKQLQETLTGRLQALEAQLLPLQRSLEQSIAAREAEAAPAPAGEPAPAAPAEEAAPIPVEDSAGKAAPVPGKPAVHRAAAPKKPGSREPSVRKAKAALAELPLGEQVGCLLAELEQFYPEHQVFAQEVLPARLREQLTAVAGRSGADSPAAFLAAQGWRMITAAEARELRQGRYCTPGEEPEIIRSRLQGVLRRLEKHYPDRVIARSIQHDHKSLAQDASALHQWLGYPGVGAMLTAYGFRYDVSAGGRPKTDVQGLLDTLRSAYAGDAKPATISQIMADHPELAAALKTLQNQGPKRFGMSLRQYLRQEGVL